MSKTAAVNIIQLFRHLAIVVFILGAFLFSVNKVLKPLSATPCFAVSVKKLTDSAFTSKAENTKEGVSSLRAVKRKTTLEATMPFLYLTVQQQITGFQVPCLVYLFGSQKETILPYAVRVPVIDFISRFFQVSIQPNAP